MTDAERVDVLLLVLAPHRQAMVRAPDLTDAERLAVANALADLQLEIESGLRDGKGP